MPVRNNAFFRVLAIAPFRNLWLSQLTSQVFMNLLFFSLMIRVYELTRSNSAVSLMVLLITLPNILLSAVAGVLVDRGERKIVMFLSHFLRAFVVLAFLLSSETLSWLYVLTFGIGVIAQFFFPAEAATIHELVTDRKLLLTANSLFSVTFFGSVILGNVLAGPVLGAFGPQTTFLIVAFAFFCASLFTAQLPGKQISDEVVTRVKEIFSGKIKVSFDKLKPNELFTDFLIGLNHIYHNRLIQRSIFIMGMAQVTVGVLGSVAPGFADRVLHLPVTSVSLLIMAPAATGMVLGAFSLGQFFRHTDRNRLIEFGYLASAFGLLAFSLVDLSQKFLPGTLVFFMTPILLLLGMANACLDVPVNTLLQENTPEEVRSRVYGVVGSVVGVAAIVPVVAAGVLADVFGVRVVVLAAGIFTSILAIKNLYTKDE